MGLLGRDQVFDARDAETRDVPCPEWGGTVRLRSIKSRERERWESSLRGPGGGKSTNLIDARARLIVLCAVDESGQRLFSADDVARLSRKSAKVLDRLFDTASELNGIADTDMPELAEDFDEAQSDDSDTD